MNGPRSWKALGPLAAAALFLSSYLLWARPYFLDWGATPSEVRSILPGDCYIPAGSIVTTRALDIDAPPEKVWPWLVQIGDGRGGFYSHDWLERLFLTDMRNMEEIDPALQSLSECDLIAWSRTRFEATWTQVLVLDPPRTLVLGDGYTFHLDHPSPGKSRLLVRYVWKKGPLPYYLLLEPAHFIMESGMMLGLKRLAERPLSHPGSGPTPSNDAPAKITGSGAGLP